jgi:hypothetical protein
MPFGMGLGEMLLVLFIVMTLLGSTKLPQISELLRRFMSGFDPTRPRLFPLPQPSRWTTVDWLLATTTAALVVVLALSYAQGR